MATDLRNLIAYLSGDTDFRAWGSGIAAQLAAVGLVKASDSGQINWGTATRPATNSYAGYEIWRFADALQATKPVFIKIEYGVAAATDRPAFRVQVGTATNGAGTLTGQTGTAIVSAAQASASPTNTLPSYCSGSTSRLNLCNNLNPSSLNWMIGVFVERTKTAAGADTGDAIAVFVPHLGYQLIPFAGAVGSVVANPALATDQGGLSAAGGEFLLSPTVAFYGKVLFASWCAYRHADMAELTPITVEHFGAARTYMPIGDGFLYSYVVQTAASAYSLAMLWE